MVVIKSQQSPVSGQPSTIFSQEIPALSDIPSVEELLRKELQSNDPFIHRALTHLAASGGKLLRPLLVLTVAKAVDARIPPPVTLACAIELVHLASLLHDDVVDEAPRRRGRKTVNHLWGDKISVLLGDYLYARASELIAEHDHPEMTRALSIAIRQMSEGQMRESRERFNFGLDEKTYLEIIGKKTAALISCACEVGALAANASREVRFAFRDFGRSLGIAFQVIDDALDFAFPGETATGKPPLDILRGNITLPIIRAQAMLSPAQRTALSRAILADPPKLSRVRRLVKSSGALSVCRRRAETDAFQALTFLPEKSEAFPVFERIARFVVERRK